LRVVVARFDESGPTVTWLGEYHVDGEVNFRLGRAGDELVADWPGFCTLRAHRRTGDSEFVAAPGADPAVVDKLHRGLATALLRHLDDKLTLHAGAVAIRGRGVAILGESRAGKSTTVAELGRRAGVEHYADDTAALEIAAGGGIRVTPTEAVSWLLDDARAALGLGGGSGKVAVDARRRGAAAAPLALMVKLVFDDAIAAPRVRPLHGHDALRELVPQVVRFVIDEPRAQLREFDHLRALLSTVPFFEIARPRDLASLAPTADAIAALLDEAAP